MSRTLNVSSSAVAKTIKHYDGRIHDQIHGLHGRIAAKKPLLRDTNNNKRLAWAKKHEQ